MMRILPVLLISLSSPGAAQVVDVSLIEACIAATPAGDIQSDCIGQAAAACSAAHEQPETTLAISECMMAETAAWDAVLNREYKAVRAQFADQPGLTDSLLAAQRAWIAFRDADCALAYDRFADGSMRSIAAADCQMRHTANRSFQLRDMQGY